jgi:hypothetical protein
MVVQLQHLLEDKTVRDRVEHKSRELREMADKNANLAVSLVKYKKFNPDNAESNSD